MLITILIFIYLVCGFINYGIEFAYWQNKYPTLAREHYESDKSSAFSSAILGPFVTFLVFPTFAWGKYGFKLK